MSINWGMNEYCGVVINGSLIINQKIQTNNTFNYLNDYQKLNAKQKKILDTKDYKLYDSISIKFQTTQKKGKVLISDWQRPGGGRGILQRGYQEIMNIFYNVTLAVVT